ARVRRLRARQPRADAGAVGEATISPELPRRVAAYGFARHRLRVAGHMSEDEPAALVDLSTMATPPREARRKAVTSVIFSGRRNSRFHGASSMTPNNLSRASQSAAGAAAKLLPNGRVACLIERSRWGEKHRGHRPPPDSRQWPSSLARDGTGGGGAGSCPGRAGELGRSCARCARRAFRRCARYRRRGIAPLPGRARTAAVGGARRLVAGLARPLSGLHQTLPQALRSGQSRHPADRARAGATRPEPRRAGVAAQARSGGARRRGTLVRRRLSDVRLVASSDGAYRAGKPSAARGEAAPRAPRPTRAPAPTAVASLPSLPDLPRLEPSLDLRFDFANPHAVAGEGQDAEPDWYRLRAELVQLGLVQGFDELLCLPLLQGVEAHWYQIETVRKVMKQFRGRVLLADEVGLGKTIEAGMVLKEYTLRGMAERMLILTPAALVGQWRDEMAVKFGIDCATSYDPLLRSDPVAFWAQPRVIASIAAARRQEHAALLASLSYDVVVVDEAHHLRDPASAGYRLVNALQKRFLLLLSATPVQNNLLELYH